MTLELGGKSPAVVFDDAHIEKTGRRIMWGPFCPRSGFVRTD